MENHFVVLGVFHRQVEIEAVIKGTRGAKARALHRFTGRIRFTDHAWIGFLNEAGGSFDLIEGKLDMGNTFEFIKWNAARQKRYEYKLKWNSLFGWWEGDWTLVTDGEVSGLEKGTAKLHLIKPSAPFLKRIPRVPVE